MSDVNPPAPRRFAAGALLLVLALGLGVGSGAAWFLRRPCSRRRGAGGRGEDRLHLPHAPHHRLRPPRRLSHLRMALVKAGAQEASGTRTAGPPRRRGWPRRLTTRSGSSSSACAPRR